MSKIPLHWSGLASGKSRTSSPGTNILPSWWTSRRDYISYSLAVPVQWLCQKVFGLQVDSMGKDSWIWKGIHRETFKMLMKVFLIWNHMVGHCKLDECFWLCELSVPVHKDCILTYLNIVVVIIEICAIYFIFIASMCIFEKKRSKILLFNCFILLYTTYRDRAIFVQGKK